MSPPGSQAQWYLARDGQQFGPISDAELGKFIELGHLQPTDLLWREGFPDWRPALVVFPPQNQKDQRGPAGAGPAAGPVAQPSQRRQPSRARPISAEAEDDVDDGRKRRGFGRLLAASLILCPKRTSLSLVRLGPMSQRPAWMVSIRGRSAVLQVATCHTHKERPTLQASGLAKWFESWSSGKARI
jgi:hypothetical protein